MIGTTLRVGYIPYLNMAPFHTEFGPSPTESDGLRFEFQRLTPRALGKEADKLAIDVGAMSLVDLIANRNDYERLGKLGIGVNGPAQSVLLFTRRPVRDLGEAMIAITDETSTSSQLLKFLLEQRYQLKALKYGRIASGEVFDGGADGLLLIGDDALLARRKSVPGFPFVTDLGTEWLMWQETPFVFAHWAVKKSLPSIVKKTIEEKLENALTSNENNIKANAAAHAIKHALSSDEIIDYWNGFAYRLTPAHETSVERFTQMSAECSIQ